MTSMSSRGVPHHTTFPASLIRQTRAPQVRLPGSSAETDTLPCLVEQHVFCLFEQNTKRKETTLPAKRNETEGNDTICETKRSETAHGQNNSETKRIGKMEA